MWPSDSSGRICGNDVEPDASEIVFLHAKGTVRRFRRFLSRFSQGKRMEHSSHHLHPEFGLLSPTPRLRRELRVAASSLLFGGIAGALCVSGVIALRHSDRAAMEIAEAPTAPAFQDAASHEGEPRSGPSADARATSPESHAGTAARPPASADVSAQRSSDTSEPAVAPASAIAPKPRMVRIGRQSTVRRSRDFHLGRSERPQRPRRRPIRPKSTQASNAAPAGSDVPAAAPEKAGVRSGTREAVANSSPQKKKVQKTVRTASSRRDDIESDSFWRDERTDDWSARPAARASADVRGATRRRRHPNGRRLVAAEEAPPKTVRNASSRRNDTGNDFFWRDDRQTIGGRGRERRTQPGRSRQCARGRVLVQRILGLVAIAPSVGAVANPTTSTAPSKTAAAMISPSIAAPGAR